VVQEVIKRYRKSQNFLLRAESTIPMGSQTFSKSRVVYPAGSSPLFAKKARGPFIWDVDGNRYIDYVSNLASITLGYAHKGQLKAVKSQLRKSVGMSLPSELEAIVAEKVVELVPSAEMVRFSKNGTDATSAAIRLARAYTGRDHVAVCGYHGWQDWFIGVTDRNKGVPEKVRQLTHSFKFNNLESLERVFEEHPQELACVILEPMNREFPTNNFLSNVVELCERNGALCVFDETITGFRFSPGGAQELFGVIPHLSTFGKGIANGFPLSVICGRRDVMMEMEEIFFSGTFGGELLSLAAANYVLDLHLANQVTPFLIENGKKLSSKLSVLIEEADLGSVISLEGHETWKFLEWRNSEHFTAEQIRAYFLQESYKEGMLTLGTFNMTLAHNHKVIEKTMRLCQKILARVKGEISNDTLINSLIASPQPSVFRIR
jgi:glutamate-1-semialdehyde 2,1-aminomutase